jgi:hypothetical protein
MRRLPTISTNSLDRYRTCPRLYRFVYIDGFEPLERTEALDFGALWHDAMEAYWRAILHGEDARNASIVDGLAAIRASQYGGDEWARIEARALFLGYHARWIDTDIAEPIMCVEQSFTVPIAGTHWTLNGRIDVGRPDGVMEHKSTTSDISLGSAYWTKLRLNAQVSNYAIAAESMDLDAAHCLYDVVRRPDASPLRATPIEKREYTQPKSRACPQCKKKSAPPAPHAIDAGDGRGIVECVDGRVVTDPGGRLYANQRLEDESAEEYESRLRALIADNSDDFYQRATVIRTGRELEEAEADVLGTIRQIEASDADDNWPRNPGSCFRFGSFCPFYAVCSGTGSLEDETKFRRRSR